MTTQAADPPIKESPGDAERPSRLRGLLKNTTELRYLGVIVVLIAMCVTFALLRSSFLSYANIVNLLSSTSILALVALGLTFVMIAGQFDLSLGATLALSGFVFYGAYENLGIPALPAIIVTIIVGAMIGGLINGTLVGRLKMSFLVATLGMLVLEDGLVELVSNGETHSFTSSLMDAIAFNTVARVPIVVILVVVAYLVAWYVLRWSFFGRDIYATGGNPLAAQLSGINVVRTIILVFAIAGAAAAAGGVVQAARIGAASPAVGGTIIFDATAAVLLGGAALSGGVGSVFGTTIGVLFLGVLQNGLTLTGLPSYWQQIVTGAIVIGSVLVNMQAGKVDADA